MTNHKLLSLALHTVNSYWIFQNLKYGFVAFSIFSILGSNSKLKIYFTFYLKTGAWEREEQI